MYHTSARVAVGVIVSAMNEFTLGMGVCNVLACITLRWKIKVVTIIVISMFCSVNQYNEQQIHYKIRVIMWRSSQKGKLVLVISYSHAKRPLLILQHPNIQFEN